MAKEKRLGEFEVNTSPKIMFPYLNTPGGLAEWFADDVNVRSDRNYNFIWDGEEHVAKLVAIKPNKNVRFEFVTDKEEEDPAYFELSIVINELTQTVYLNITDYSEMYDSDEEFEEMWEGLVENLRNVLSV